MLRSWLESPIFDIESLLKVLILRPWLESFTFELKSPPAAALILKAAKIQKGASESGVQVVGKITFDQAKEIGKQKMQDLNAMDEEAAAMIIAGTARSMGG